MGQITILNQLGDQVIEWDIGDDKSVAKAEGAFNALKAEGYEFYEIETRTVETKGKVVKSFKKSLTKIIAAPGVKAGSKAMGGGPVRISA